ncbi:MAG TPA: threonine/serine dehydratase [Longimicrobiales bacterium]|nr:threonine/serine dehydratase [Longimicrobiales bacterium]
MRDAAEPQRRPLAPHDTRAKIPLPVISHADVVAARRLIEGRIHRTPLVTSRTLGDICGSTKAFLKVEAFQRTGSFKPRGALNKVLHLSDEQRHAGLVAASAGNHAQAVAYAATSEGVKCTVVMPETAPFSKIEASRRYGAEVILEPSFADAFRRADQLRTEMGYTFIHPYDDEHIIAGAGTVGLEIVEDLPDVDAIVVATGGGGLVVGIAAAIEATHPHVRIIGVEPEGAAGLYAALDAGQVVQLDRIRTIADGLATPSTGRIVLEHARTMVDEVVLVSDEEIIQAMLFLLERSKIMAEPAGAAAVAAMLAGRISFPPESNIVAVISGGNIDLSMLRTFLPT